MLYMCKMDKLLKDIEVLRNKMIRTTLEKGFTNNESIMISQELDQLLNFYQQARLSQEKGSLNDKNKY